MTDDQAAPSGPARPRRYLSLLHRVAAVNALALAVVVGVTVAVLDPRRVTTFSADAEGVLMGLSLLIVVAANVLVVRRVVGPVQGLTSLARRVDLTEAAERMPVPGAASEAQELAVTFNDMLERLAAERREATGRVLAGQEAERLRIAQELHDQIGQELTAVLLGLARVRTRVPDDVRAELEEVQEALRDSLDGVRTIALELRPEALDDLGLESALAVLCERFAERSGLQVSQQVSYHLPRLSPEVELVVYRIAQESLTNVARHADTDSAHLALAYEPAQERLTLTVSDRGRGLRPGQVAGAGMRGMRERAALVGARLSIEARSPAGVEVRLVVPVPGAP